LGCCFLALQHCLQQQQQQVAACRPAFQLLLLLASGNCQLGRHSWLNLHPLKTAAAELQI
jgi:hypothetical protein